MTRGKIMVGDKIMTGYKAFDENLQCRGFQVEVGKAYDTGE